MIQNIQQMQPKSCSGNGISSDNSCMMCHVSFLSSHAVWRFWGFLTSTVNGAKPVAVQRLEWFQSRSLSAFFSTAKQSRTTNNSNSTSKSSLHVGLLPLFLNLPPGGSKELQQVGMGAKTIRSYDAERMQNHWQGAHFTIHATGCVELLKKMFLHWCWIPD